MRQNAVVRLVDWNQLAAEWKEHRSASFFTEAAAGGASWIFDYQAPKRWDPGWDAATSAGRVYHALRGELVSGTRMTCDTFFSAFFWEGEDGRLRELMGASQVNPQVFAITIGPSTVHAYLKLFMTINLEHLRGPFKRALVRIREAGEDLACPEDFEGFCDYLWQWVDLLQDAASREAGVVISLE